MYLSRIMLRLCQGQQLDISMTKAKELISVDDYLSMVSGKTAALFEAAAYLGAVCGGAPKVERERLREFGRLLGICFQLFDDVAGIWGSTQRGLDKPCLDLEKRKKNYPVIYAYSCLNRSEQRDLIETYYQCDYDAQDSLAHVRHLLDKTHAKQRTKEEGTKYLHQALETLNAVRGNPVILQQIERWVRAVTNKQLESVRTPSDTGE